jgi:hypothetical protein
MRRLRPFVDGIGVGVGVEAVVVGVELWWNDVGWEEGGVDNLNGGGDMMRFRS